MPRRPLLAGWPADEDDVSVTDIMVAHAKSRGCTCSSRDLHLEHVVIDGHEYLAPTLLHAWDCAIDADGDSS